MNTRHFILAFAAICTIRANSTAQSSLTLPQASQEAEVRQKIGLTDITILYHSPAVNGRKIWGELVPYGQVWRAGANENTTISFTDDVTIDGKIIVAGTYGLHMIPDADEWTIILSKNHTSWGSYFYKEGEDALRIKVKPQSRDFLEWLDYSFVDRQASSVKAQLSWEKLKVGFTINVDSKNITLRHIREQLRSMPSFSWHGWEEAAHYCIENKVNYDEALAWINTSIKMEENFANVAAKTQLLTAMGKTQEAAESKKKMIGLLESAPESKVNVFGYELMNEHDMDGALDVFRMNAKKHPDSWNAYDSLGEAYANAGDKKQALSTYKTALSKAPDDQKDRIKKIISGLEKG